MKRKNYVLSFMLCFFVSVNVSAARFYNAVELPSPYNGDWTYTVPTALNDSGEVVGYSSPLQSTSNTYVNAVYWPNPNAITMLNLYGSTQINYSIANDINNSGLIVGAIDNPDNQATQTLLGALWDRGVLVSTPGVRDANDPANMTTMINSINDDNVMVGNNLIINGLSRAFVYNRFGAFDDGALLTEQTQSVEARSINNEDEVVGHYSGEGFKVHASGSPFEGLANILTVAEINDNGVMSAKRYNECVLIGDGTPIYFSSVDYDCAPNAINNNRVVVGETNQFDTEGNYYKAFVYDDRETASCETGIRDLTAITAFGSLPDTILTSAKDVNNEGQIVALGVRDGVTNAYLLTPAADYEPLPLSLDSNQNDILDSCEDVEPDPTSSNELAWLIPVLGLLLN